MLFNTGKEKLADYLGISGDEARNIMHSFLGRSVGFTARRAVS